jgi:hypothetical protein
VLLPDGNYRPPRGGSGAVSAQQVLLSRLAAGVGD